MYKQTKGDLDSLEAQEAMQTWELSKYTEEELKDELERRERSGHYECNIPDDTCEHEMEMGYCQVKGCEGSY